MVLNSIERKTYTTRFKNFTGREGVVTDLVWNKCRTGWVSRGDVSKGPYVCIYGCICVCTSIHTGVYVCIYVCTCTLGLGLGLIFNDDGNVDRSTTRGSRVYSSLQ